MAGVNRVSEPAGRSFIQGNSRPGPRNGPGAAIASAMRFRGGLRFTIRPACRGLLPEVGESRASFSAFRQAM